MDYTPGQVIQPTFTNAWVSPKGEFHFVPYHSHILVASVLGYTEQVMEMLGWAKVTEGTILSTKPLTQAQMDTLWDVVPTITNKWDRDHFIECLNQYF